VIDDRPESDDLAREHCALLNAYGSVQRRCSRLLDEQARQLRAQEAELMRLRAAVIVRDSALLWAQQERAELEAALPGLRRGALRWRPVVAGAAPCPPPPCLPC
tara:strand:+ start:199 stop:510 length:312 start_codon:yes stop_codon:yes gene_type:complete